MLYQSGIIICLFSAMFKLKWAVSVVQHLKGSYEDGGRLPGCHPWRQVTQHPWEARWDYETPGRKQAG